MYVFNELYPQKLPITLSPKYNYFYLSIIPVCLKMTSKHI